MKDYSLKINGQNYDVQIDEVNEASTVARVIVNGIFFFPTPNVSVVRLLCRRYHAKH